MCLFAGKARAEAGAAAAGIPESAAGAAGAEDAGISGEPSGGRSLPLCLAKDLLAEGAGSGQASMGFGGLWEPLLSRDIEELTERGRALGLTDAMLSTNGTLLSRSRARDLIGAGLTRLMVSLDAASEGVYSLMRPGASLAETEGNVMGFLAEREAAGKRLPLLRLSFCVTRLNEHELEPFLSRWEGKADFFSVQRYGDFGAGPPVFAANPPGPAPSGRCAQPFKRLAVRHDGTALPCCDLSGRPLALGNVRGSGLGGLWNGKAVASLREAILADDPEGLPEACRRCRAKYAPA
jgi:radical SAM protein with 4Fe4S-binding SPASM domain